MVGGVMQAKEQAKQIGAAEDQQRREKMEMIKSMNIQNQDLTLQDKQNMFDTFARKSDNNLEAIQANSVVRNAIGESGLTGRTVERVSRDTDAQRIRANAGLQENYERDYSKLYIQREANKQQTAAQIAGMAKIQHPSRTAQTVGILMGAASAGASAYFGGAGKGGNFNWSGALSSGLNTVARQQG